MIGGTESILVVEEENGVQRHSEMTLRSQVVVGVTVVNPVTLSHGGMNRLSGYTKERKDLFRRESI